MNANKVVLGKNVWWTIKGQMHHPFGKFLFFPLQSTYQYFYGQTYPLLEAEIS